MYLHTNIATPQSRLQLQGYAVHHGRRVRYVHLDIDNLLHKDRDPGTGNGARPKHVSFSFYPPYVQPELY